MRKTVLSLAVTGIFLIAGCEKHDPTCYLAPPSFEVNGVASSEGVIDAQLVANQNLVLSALDYEGYSYHWTGPNGYESDSATAEVDEPGSEMSGEYQLTLSKGICSGTTKVQVNITSISPACTPQNNRLQFQTTALFPNYINFGYSNMSGSTSDYEFTANGSQGDLNIRFGTWDAPQSGVYTIQPNCFSSDSPSEVCLAITFAGNYITATSGQIYVTRQDNGNYVISFCSVEFNSPFSVDLIADCKITEP